MEKENSLIKINPLDIKVDPRIELEYDAHKVMMEKFMNEASKAFDDHMKKYLLENLRKIGYNFSDYFQLIEFVKNRVTRVATASDPNSYQLILDFNTPNQKLIGSYIDNVEFKYEDNVVTATFCSKYK